MADKDKEAFEKWFKHKHGEVVPSYYHLLEEKHILDLLKESFEAACEYMRSKSTPLDALSLYEKLEKERAENKKLIAEVEWQEERNTGNTLMYQEQIKKLREALGFYADISNYVPRRSNSDIFSCIIGDNTIMPNKEAFAGNRARKALKEIGE